MLLNTRPVKALGVREGRHGQPTSILKAVSRPQSLLALAPVLPELAAAKSKQFVPSAPPTHTRTLHPPSVFSVSLILLPEH